MRRIGKKRKGVSLVEIIVVIIIIAILAAATFLGGGSSQKSAKQAVALSDLDSFKTMASQMLYEHPQLALKSSVTQSEGEKLFNKYLGDTLAFSSGESEKLDPWGKPYEVMFSTTVRNSGKQEFYVTLYSAGANGVIDTTHLDDDDCGIIVALSDGAVISEDFGFKSSEFDHQSHDVSKIIIGKGTYTS